MPNFRWGIICENSIVDSVSNNISLINVIEAIQVPELPSNYALNSVIVILWEKTGSDDSEQFSFRFPIKYHSGEVFPSPKEHQVEITAKQKRLRTKSSALGLPIKEEGTLNIIVEIKNGGDWREVGSIPIEVALQKPA